MLLSVFSSCMALRRSKLRLTTQRYSMHMTTSHMIRASQVEEPSLAPFGQTQFVNPVFMANF